ncbi:hypothetical protein HKB22_02730, partial [Vibrio parahaemolyticus]|nr:hypothetical protein [Vibrio parahaemolyticus]
AERAICQWEEANERFINALIEGKVKYASKLAGSAGTVTRSHVGNYHSSDRAIKQDLGNLHDLFKRLRVDVYIQVLTFTGMRNQEVGALKNNAAKCRDGRFYIQSLLSKTAPGKMMLNWVSNEDAYRAV